MNLKKIEKEISKLAGVEKTLFRQLRRRNNFSLKNVPTERLLSIDHKESKAKRKIRFLKKKDNFVEFAQERYLNEFFRKQPRQTHFINVKLCKIIKPEHKIQNKRKARVSLSVEGDPFTKYMQTHRISGTLKPFFSPREYK